MSDRCNTKDTDLRHCAKGESGFSTRSVHSGERERQTSDSITTPIHQTSTYWFRDSEEVRAYQEGRKERDEYGRYGNPTLRAVEHKLSELEGADDTVLFASGMCAATTTFLALLPKNGHLVVTSDCYRRTRQFAREYLTKLGVETTVIEPSNNVKLAEALRDDTTLFFTELPTNPYLRVMDIPETVRICHARGVKVVVDSTFASPINYQPLSDGADLVIHSATKYLGGHNDLLAGSASGKADLMAEVRKAVGILGGVLAPHSAYLLLRGLKTLSLRIARQNETGLAVAKMLEAHPKVRRVYYPLLDSHPDAAVAKRLLRGGGGVVTFDLDTDFDGAVRFVDACKIPYIGPSLGGVESLIEMPALMSYWDITSAQRAEFGISDSLVRLACGVEDTADLLADLQNALTKI